MHNSVWGHLQGVEGAQALKGIWSYFWDLVVAQVSALKEKAKELAKEMEVLEKGSLNPNVTTVSLS